MKDFNLKSVSKSIPLPFWRLLCLFYRIFSVSSDVTAPFSIVHLFVVFFKLAGLQNDDIITLKAHTFIINDPSVDEITFADVLG